MRTIQITPTTGIKMLGDICKEQEETLTHFRSALATDPRPSTVSVRLVDVEQIVGAFDVLQQIAKQQIQF